MEERKVPVTHYDIANLVDFDKGLKKTINNPIQWGRIVKDNHASEIISRMQNDLHNLYFHSPILTEENGYTSYYHEWRGLVKGLKEILYPILGNTIDDSRDIADLHIDNSLMVHITSLLETYDAYLSTVIEILQPKYDAMLLEIEKLKKLSEDTFSDINIFSESITNPITEDITKSTNKLISNMNWVKAFDNAQMQRNGKKVIEKICNLLKKIEDHPQK